MTQAAGLTQSTFSPDRLIAGNPGLLQTRSITLDDGNLARGSLLGRKFAGTVPTTGTAAGGNTGTGTMTSVTGGAKTQEGVYTITCITAVSNAGEFEVRAPDGSLVGIADVAVAFTSPHLNFTISDATDFIRGDSFTVTVAAINKYILSLAAAIDGSQVPVAILAEAADATGGDKVVQAYFAGDFDENAITFGTGHTAASVRDGLHDKGIRLIPSITA